MAPPSYQHETSRLRRLLGLKGLGYKYTRHALEEMKKDGLSRQDIKEALTGARVARVEQNRFEETWNCRGRNLDGTEIEVVIVAYEEEIKIKVITVWARK